MPRVVAYEEAKAGRARHRGRAFNTWFLKSSNQTPDQPVAFLTERDLHHPIKPHWHRVDQFQVVVGGNGTLGRHRVAPYTVHFSRAHTPYGPIADDGSNAIAFFTLRPCFDPGSNYLPDTKDALREIVGRNPFQVSALARFPTADSARAAGGSQVSELSGMKNEFGLYGAAISLAAGARASAPDPATGAGQYLLIVKGSLLYAGGEHKPYTVVFVEPHEAAFQLTAGGEGLEALIMNFPKAGVRDNSGPAVAAAQGFRKWQCELCAFAYDEAAGLPDEGIPAGTRWADVPDDWICPDCSTSKSDFRMVEVS